MTKLLLPELSNKILGMCFTVHNILGPGLLEHCYREAMCVELEIAGIPFEREKVFPLTYKGRDIGGYIADISINAGLILELKSMSGFHPAMEAQIINYMHLSKCRVGYLINFRGPKVEWKRYVLEDP